VNETDRAGRYHWRPFYYLETHKTLLDHPAYIGAAQTALQRYGYSCGEIDGVPSPEFTEAIARLQKNHSMRVTGTLTRPVRRVLFLP
jgi:peptidoglycan hydrolase-like protein with peptidoglycan-binding domain